jgi:hypothetical protein
VNLSVNITQSCASVSGKVLISGYPCFPSTGSLLGTSVTENVISGVIVLGRNIMNFQISVDFASYMGGSFDLGLAIFTEPRELLVCINKTIYQV